ncbi:ferrochelatase [uncultured Porticoccus sp.]|uniref:ferrochelatase n=1 Tax=uncultured Porticoccus sp. TaxID=1256050 RepID=UPI00262B90C1|nr:ferrochelatase [uncultured Porticoccus sp.]
MNKTSVILVNLGTPKEPTPASIARFLRAFLSDPRVVEVPRLLWWFLLRLVIIPLRAKRVAHAYHEIWWEEGSPLRVISGRQVADLQEVLTDRYGEEAPVVAEAMTYGEPALDETIQRLEEKGIEKFLIIPMYPQYSGSTTGAIYDQVAQIIQQSRNVPDMTVIKSFHDDIGYIQSIAESIKAHWAEHGRNEKLLMSFHGIPQDYVDKGDPYSEHCRATAHAIASALELASSEWSMSFQSRFGPKKWLQPYTDDKLKQWLEEGIRSVDIVSPAFTADCLETLEELNMGYRELFIEQGGEKYHYIPCVNNAPLFINALAEITAKKLVLNQ